MTKAAQTTEPIDEPAVPPPPARISFNRQIADKLRQAADLLAQQSASPFRVAAYRRAAKSVEGLDEPVTDLYVRDGISGLESIPGVGRSIASAVAELCRTGRWGFLEHLRGTLDPARLFQAIPGIGPALAVRFHAELGADTLEELEAAAQDGRLAAMHGIGRRRAELVRAAVGQMLARARPRRSDLAEQAPAEMLLDVDREYRAKARADALPKIAPKRFNPRHEAWLPVLHTQRDKWHFTAMFSNTARAHDLARIHDWVVIYFSSDHDAEAQCTVVTETHGELDGLQVIRGREADCRAYYRTKATEPERAGLTN